jgi:hypothetical protein
MKKRIAIAALVGVITFLTIYTELNVIYAHSQHPNPMLHSAALLQATLFAAINAAVTFGVSFALTKS